MRNDAEQQDTVISPRTIAQSAAGWSSDDHTQVRAHNAGDPSYADRDRNEREVVQTLPKAWPFYVVADVSQSMWFSNRPGDYTPWDVISDGLTGFVDEIDYHPTARDICHLSIIAFGDRVETLLPLTRFTDDQLSFGGLPKMTFTDYGLLFKHLVDVVDQDASRLTDTFRVMRPVLYFITDGHAQVRGGRQEDSAWMPFVRRLHTLAARPIVVALGLGDAKAAALRDISAAPGPACLASHGTPPSDLLREIINNIIKSVTASSTAGEFVFDVPSGMRLL